MEQKNATEDLNVSKEKVEEVEAGNESDTKEFVDPWEHLLFGRRRVVQPQEIEEKEKRQMKVEDNEDSQKNDDEGKGFSWI